MKTKSLLLTLIMFCTCMSMINAQSCEQLDSIMKSRKFSYPKEINTTDIAIRDYWLAHHAHLRMTLSEQKYNGNQDFVKIVNEKYPEMEMVDWMYLTLILKIETWANKLNLKPGSTFFVTREKKMKAQSNSPYFVIYEPSGKIPAKVHVYDNVDNKLYLCSMPNKTCPILMRRGKY